MRQTRFLSAAAAALLTVTVTAASGQTNGRDTGTERDGGALERLVMPDSTMSQQDLRALAAEQTHVPEEPAAAVARSRAPTTSGRAEHNAAIRAPGRAVIQ